MLRVYVQNNHLLERDYILHILLTEFLGLEYTVIIDETSKMNTWQIELENHNKLIIKDHFFSKYSQDLEYLSDNNLPRNIKFGQNQFVSATDIPIIFGSSDLDINDSSLVCDMDLFASSFFMLTRWEEYVNPVRDEHNRFPANECIAFKYGFLHRPVVNEYTEMLWNMLKHLGINQKRKVTKPQIFLTHDVDRLYFWKNKSQLFRLMAGDILKRRNLSMAFHRYKEYSDVLSGKVPDPFDTFNWLMQQSEALGIQSHFYFMSGGLTAFDNSYSIDDPKSLELIQKIKKRGHSIGIHPSYNAYNNFEQFKKEKDLLEKIVGQKIVEGREHYLRFEVPTTWQIWEDNGMKIDSTCGYADMIGFRCGTGNEFSVFNILARKKLNLKERPLIVMDCTLFDYAHFTEDEAIDAILSISKTAGSITLLWHNSYVKYNKFYSKLLKELK